MNIPANVLEEIRRIRRSNVTDSSRSVYNRYSNKFIEWIHKTHPSLVGELPHSIRLEDLTPEIFLQYLLSLKASMPVLSSNRSALYNLYRDERVSPSDHLVRELKVHYRGFRVIDANEKQKGTRPVTTGKKPLEFSFYQYIAEEMLKSSKKEFIFARCWMILSWNLMCRAQNTAEVRHSHLEWCEDSLVVYFAKQKNDQLGKKVGGKHIYCNPFLRHICPVLSLAIYWVCNPRPEKDGKLFGY